MIKYIAKPFGDVNPENEVCCYDPELSDQDCISATVALNAGMVKEEDACSFYHPEAYSYASKNKIVIVRNNAN